MQNLKQPRTFVKEDLVIDAWETVEGYFINLLERPLESVADLEIWMRDRSELDAVLEEEGAWRYIKSNIDTRDEDLKKAFTFWIEEIAPKIAPIDDKLNRKLNDSPFIHELEPEKYRIFLRSLKKQIELFREENVSIYTEIQKKEQEYGAIAAAMMVHIDGEEMTLQKAALRLNNVDRAVRQEAFEKIAERRLQDRDKLDALMDELIALRQQVAKNVGFENFRDYAHVARGRFDYTVADCEAFHTSIASEVVPLLNKIDERRRNSLNLDTYRPWDGSVDEEGKAALKPFDGSQTELIDKSIKSFTRVRPFFGACLQTMKNMGHLDLESKEGKAPGGFNYPLYEVGVPFIYMNAVGSQRDLETIMHEGGHAVHAFLSHPLELCDFKNTPAEVAELASMSMEFLSMHTWDEFYNAEDLVRAQKNQMEQSLRSLPWIAAVDKFQHWIYTTEHTADDRRAAWASILKEFDGSVTDWGGYEDAFANMWQKQLHIFEIPFYYIEYGMAQLGAMAMWRQYREKGEEALDNYEAALKLGYTKSIPELYEAAGIQFDFSTEYVRELVEYVGGVLASLR